MDKPVCRLKLLYLLKRCYEEWSDRALYTDKGVVFDIGIKVLFLVLEFNRVPGVGG